MNERRPIRILYVWDAEYPWDVRTEKVCRALTDHGNHVVITARNLHGLPRAETRPEGIVERLKAGPAFARRWLSFPAFFNPVWLFHLARMIKKHQVDLIMVRDLPLAPTALLASRGRVPVVLDMAENYPAMISDVWTDGRQGRLDFLVRNPSMVAAVERSVLRRVDFVITVVEESSQRLIGLGLPANRTAVVSNTPSKTRVLSPKPRDTGTPLRLIYLGLMERHRGIENSLEAAAILQRDGVAFHLDLVGDGRDHEDFKARAGGLGLKSDHVTFRGRLPHAEAIALVADAQVGLVPHHARESWNTTIPNKLFDYMAAGLAVVTSDAVPAARVVNDTGAGLVYRSGDSQELADRIRAFVDLQTWERCRRAGQEAIRLRYNWEADIDVLLRVVAEVSLQATRQDPASGGLVDPTRENSPG